jgi:hypothetical protein
MAGLAVWNFACPNGDYTTGQTDHSLKGTWALIARHVDHGLLPEALEALVDTTVLFAAVTHPACTISDANARLLLRLLERFRSQTEAHVRPALAVAVTFWGLSLGADEWDFWKSEKRKQCWRDYTRPDARRKDTAALFLVGLSRLLANYSQLMLNHASIKTITFEIDRYMQMHSSSDTTKLTLPFLPTGFDVRRHVRESVWFYLQDTESQGPFTKSAKATRDELLLAIQSDGGEGYMYEAPQPFMKRTPTKEASGSTT